MELKKIIGTAKDQAGELVENAHGQVKEWLDEYKKTIVVLETFGYTVGKFNIGMGVLPEIHTSISGSLANIKTDKIEKMIEEHKTDKLLVSLLKALIMTKQFSDHVELKLTSVSLQVTLGVVPNINVEVH